MFFFDALFFVKHFRIPLQAKNAVNAKSLCNGGEQLVNTNGQNGQESGMKQAITSVAAEVESNHKLVENSHVEMAEYLRHVPFSL